MRQNYKTKFVLPFLGFFSLAVFFILVSLANPVRVKAAIPPGSCTNNQNIQVCRDCVTCYEAGQEGLRQCADNVIACDLQAAGNSSSGESGQTGTGVAGDDCTQNPAICGQGLACDQTSKRCLIPVGGSCAATRYCVTGSSCNQNVCTADSGGVSGGSGTVSRTLSQGSTGDDVRTLQTALNSNGANIGVDGVFGRETFNAVQTYQRNRGLRVDGIAGPETLRSLGIYREPAAGNSGASGDGNAGSSSGGGNCGGDPNLVFQNGICLPRDQATDTSIRGSSSFTELLIRVISFFLFFAGIVAVLVLIVGGFWYITSSGSEEQAEKGKKAIINAIIGLVVVLLSYTIVTIISDTLTRT